MPPFKQAKLHNWMVIGFLLVLGFGTIGVVNHNPTPILTPAEARPIHLFYDIEFLKTDLENNIGNITVGQSETAYLGDTATFQRLFLSDDITQDSQATSKSYVDSQIGSEGDTQILVGGSDLLTQLVRTIIFDTNLEVVFNGDTVFVEALGSVSSDSYLPRDPADSDVDMNNFNIFNLGDPTADSDATHKRYVDDEISAVKSDTRLLSQTAHLPLTQIPAGDTASLRFHVPTNLFVWNVGIQNDVQDTSADFTIEVFNLTGSTSIFNSNEKYESGNPLASASGPIDISIRMTNTSLDTASISAFVEYTNE